jgi:hypothetical protein
MKLVASKKILAKRITMKALVKYTAKNWRKRLIIPAIVAGMFCSQKALAASFVNTDKREFNANLELNKGHVIGSHPFTFKRSFKVAQTTDQVVTATINITSTATSLGGRQFMKNTGTVEPYTYAYSDFVGFVNSLGKGNAIQPRGNGLYTVNFDDRSSASVRPYSSGSVPTIQINLVNSNTPYKIRYQQTACPVTAFGC